MIEALNETNFTDFLNLMKRYQQFYQVADICQQRNRQFFLPFTEDNPAGAIFLYRQGDEVVAFATVYISLSSTLAAKVAVLNDLFTVVDQRGLGIAKALLEHSRRYAKASGSPRLQWLTARNNAQAQLLYDGLDTRKSDWHFYTYNTE